MTVRTGHDAGRAARAWVGRDAYHLMCKAFVRAEVFNVNPSTSGTAIECWNEAEHKHRVTDPEKVPAFVPVFMDTSASAEHVGATVGRDSTGHRLIVSTDAGPNRTIGLVRLADLARSWGPIIGWSEDLDGQRIWTPPPVTPTVELANVVDAALHERDESGDPPLHPRAVGFVERALVAERLLAPAWVNGRFGIHKIKAYAAWQKRIGYTGAQANGVPGRVSLTKLGARHGFKVI